MRLILFFFMVIMVMSGCKVEENTTEIQGDYVQHSNESKLNLEFETIIVNDEVKISLAQVPEVKSFLLEQENEEDAKFQLQLTEAMSIANYKDKEYILLKYNCGNKSCTWLLLEYENGEIINSIELIEFGVANLLSPQQNNQYLAITVGEIIGPGATVETVIVVDLNKFKIISKPNELVPLNKEMYPIVGVEWHENALNITFADLDELTYENVMNWYESEKRSIQSVKWVFED